MPHRSLKVALPDAKAALNHLKRPLNYEEVEKLLGSIELQREQLSLDTYSAIILLPGIISVLANAVREMKGLSRSFAVSRVTVSLSNEESKDESKCWELKADGEVNLVVKPRLLEQYPLPSDAEMLTVLLQTVKEEVEPSIGALMIKATFTPAQSSPFISPLITTTGSHSLAFTLFPGGEPTPTQQPLARYISAVTIPMQSLGEAEEAKVVCGEKEFVVSFCVRQLSEQLRLVVRLGNRILYSKTFLCYEVADIPKHMTKGKNDVFFFYCTTDVSARKHLSPRFMQWKQREILPNSALSPYCLYELVTSA